mmetsp:Transcript_71247/g.137558  ORF Transcript_71247/g.137558 Transcript_71247/m.137558 type:complete len:114 (+) Transcript_71247:842-1183(+)
MRSRLLFLHSRNSWPGLSGAVANRDIAVARALRQRLRLQFKRSSFPLPLRQERSHQHPTMQAAAARRKAPTVADLEVVSCTGGYPTSVMQSRRVAADAWEIDFPSANGRAVLH